MNEIDRHELPTTPAQLMARRKGPAKLKDLLVPVFAKLISDASYRRLLSATTDKDAREGKCRHDDHEAARLLRIAASEIYPDLINRPISEFITALNGLRAMFQMRRKDLVRPSDELIAAA